MDSCEIDTVFGASDQGREFQDWQFSDEEQGETRTRVVPKAKGKLGRGRARSSQVSLELKDPPLPLSNPENVVGQEFSASIRPPQGMSPNKGDLGSLPCWSDDSGGEEQREVPQKNKEPFDEGALMRMLEKLDSSNSGAARDNVGNPMQGSMEGGEGRLSYMSVDFVSQRGNSQAGGLDINQQRSAEASPIQKISASTPTRQQPARRLPKSRARPGQKLSQAYHRPRKRAKVREVQRGNNLIKTMDQLRRLAGIGRASMPMLGPSQMSTEQEMVDAIVSNTDDEDDTNHSHNNGFRKAIDMSPPFSQSQSVNKPTTSCSTESQIEGRNSLSAVQQLEVEERMLKKNGRWRGKLAVERKKLVEGGGTCAEGGLSAQRSFLAKLTKESVGGGAGGAWTRGVGAVRGSRGKKKGQDGLVGRLQEIMAADKARKEKFDAITSSERIGIRHIDLLALEVRWEGHLVNAVCDVVAKPSDRAHGIPPKLTAFLNSKAGGHRVEVLPGVKLRVYEPWTRVDLGQNQGVGLLCNFILIVE